jgi:hypothetical protein
MVIVIDLKLNDLKDIISNERCVLINSYLYTSDYDMEEVHHQLNFKSKIKVLYIFLC